MLIVPARALRVGGRPFGLVPIWSSQRRRGLEILVLLAIRAEKRGPARRDQPPGGTALESDRSEK
jgi:hypothetical protein